MPVVVTYPGVYIEELPSGSHTIAPVATAITAFVGRTSRGPVAATSGPVTIFSFGDYASLFGGLHADFPLGYAVQDFFNNGGSEAVIARLFEPSDEGNGVAQLDFGSGTSSSSALKLKGANPGAWGNSLTAKVDRMGITRVSAAPFARYGLTADDLFNLTLRWKNPVSGQVTSESFQNLSVRRTGKAAEYPYRIDRALLHQSNRARVSFLPDEPPAEGDTAAGKGGNDGIFLKPQSYQGDRAKKTGIFGLEDARDFNLLCIPPDRRLSEKGPAVEQDLDPSVRQAAANYCFERQAFFIVDPPAGWSDKVRDGKIAEIAPADLGIEGESRRNAAVYFPRVYREDALANGKASLFAPCGLVAGAIAENDVARGVWKAPAGQDSGLTGITKLELNLTDQQNGVLNPLGINCLRNFPVVGPVIWGARTLQGDDRFSDEFKYVNVRRLVLFIEKSLQQGTQWAIFESNDESLWAGLHLSVGAFLADLNRQGAFYSYKVACDATTTTRDDIENGIVNIMVYIAPVKPAEFIAIKIQQKAGGPG